MSLRRRSTISSVDRRGHSTSAIPIQMPSLVAIQVARTYSDWNRHKSQSHPPLASSGSTVRELEEAKYHQLSYRRGHSTSAIPIQMPSLVAIQVARTYSDWNRHKSQSHPPLASSGSTVRELEEAKYHQLS